MSTAYRGRFAPSPTGPLHFGSLVAAVGSYLDARSCGGEWHLRIEDVDRPRCDRQTAEGMLRTLSAFGFAWDGTTVWQSRRDAAYREALERLRGGGRVFPCACTRREVADSQLRQGVPAASDGAHVYPGTCRRAMPTGKAVRSWRLRVDQDVIAFTDRVQGPVVQNLGRDVGDFVLLRADGLFAYQLAVVVDDAAAGITHVVRGADLLDSTPRQILIQRLLDVPTPDYAHLPAAVNAAGEKLSKQTRAAEVSAARPVAALVAALRFLGQAVPAGLDFAELAEVWDWATRNWDIGRVQPARARPAPE